MHEQLTQIIHMNRFFVIVCLLFFGSAFAPSRALARADDVRDILERYEASIGTMHHAQFSLHVELRMREGDGPEMLLGRGKTDCLRDGGRWRVKSRGETFLPIYVKSISHDNAFVQSDRFIDFDWQELEADQQDEREPLLVRAVLRGECEPMQTAEEIAASRGDSDGLWRGSYPGALLYDGSFLYGYVEGQLGERLSASLAAGRVTPDAATRDGPADASLVLIEAEGKYGKHRVWFDPSVGYLPRRVEIWKGAEDILNTGPVADLKAEAGKPPLEPDKRPDWPNLDTRAVELLYDNIDIRPVENRFAIFGFTQTITRHYDAGHTASQRETLSVSDLVFDPPTTESDFAPEIPNGTTVIVRCAPQIAYEWRDGKVVKLLDQEAAAALTGHAYLRDGNAGRFWVRFLGINAVAIGGALAWYLWRRARRGKDA